MSINCKDCGGKLIKKYNIEYHKLGRVIQLSKDEYICLKCGRITKAAKINVKILAG